MTWPQLIAKGRGRLTLWLEVAGIPWVFATDDLVPAAGSSRDGGATDWYVDGGFLGVLPVMQWEGISYDEQSSFTDGTVEVSPLKVVLVDHRGLITALFSDWQARAMTRLTSTLSKAEVAAAVVDLETVFPAGGGVVWIGEECIAYDHTDAAGELHLLTRGYYGTIAREHRVDLDLRPVPLAPEVLDGPQSLVGRRCYLHAAEVSDQGAVSWSTCIYRGHVRPGVEPSGGEWPITIDHISTYLTRQVCSRGVTTPLWPGYWYSGIAGLVSTSTIRVIEVEDVGAGEVTQEVLITIPGGWYASPADLIAAIMTEVRADCAGWTRFPSLMWAPGDPCTLNTQGYSTADHRLHVLVREGDPLWALGFEPGAYIGELGAAGLFEAQTSPRAFVCELPRLGLATAGAVIYGDETTRFPPGSYVLLGGRAPYLRVGALGGTGTALHIDVWGYDAWSFEAARAGGRFVAVESESDLQISSCMVIDSGDPRDWIERCFGLDPADGTPPDLVVGGIEDYDFCWDELLEARLGLDVRLHSFRDCITEPTGVDELVCDRLGMLGIAPRLTSDGRIGFSRLRPPSEVSADSVEVDDALWSVVEAAQVRSILSGEPLLNRISVSHSFSYRSGEWSSTKARLFFEPGRGALGKTWGRDYSARGLHIMRVEGGSRTYYESTSQLEEALAVVALGVHFGMYGRPGAVVTVPCTWTAKRLLVGDIVLVTHPCITDLRQGAVGVDEVLGVVVGATRSVTEDAPDQLVILLTASRGWPIAPCCYASGWNPVTLKLNIGATEFGPTEDMGHFSDGMVLRFEERDTLVALGVGTGTIAAGGIDIPGRTITLTADPFGGAFPVAGVLVFFADWDEVVASQQAWLYECDSSYTLGVGADPGMTWGL